jgi:putative SOS response-associated peptidase YedK
MCNEFAQERAWREYSEMMQREALKIITPELPDLPFTATRRPTDPALVIRAAPGGVALDIIKWGWPKPGSKRPILWLQSEHRRDPPETRGIVPIERFVEYRGDRAPKEKFEFWPAINEPMGMGVIIRGDRWAHLTTAPGPEVAPVHDRQPALVRLTDWGRFVTQAAWPADLMAPTPEGTLKALQVR